MTHAELVVRAGRWLRGAGCHIVFEELVTAQGGEIPDAVGFRDGGRLTYLVECKASRADFLADKKKPHRVAGGIGCYRYFMCPPGMIRADELPDRWGLLHAYPTRVTLEAGRHPQKWDAKTMARYYHKPDREGELAMLCSALNRLRLDLGEATWKTRVHRSFTDRQLAPRRHFLFYDNDDT